MKYPKMFKSRKVEIQPPIGKIERGYYVLDGVPNNLEKGLDERIARKIYQYCHQFPNKVILTNPEEGFIEVYGDSLEGLLILGSKKGEEVAIRVECVEGTKPERIATQIYRIFKDGKMSPKFEREAAHPIKKAYTPYKYE